MKTAQAGPGTPSERITARLAEIEAVAEAATPGPWAYDYEQEKGMGWYVGQFTVGDDGLLISGDVTEYEFEHCWEDGELRADFEDWQPIGVEPVCEGHYSNAGNAEFIAQSRTAIPALVSALRLAQEVLSAQDRLHPALLVIAAELEKLDDR